jgi:transketolase
MIFVKGPATREAFGHELMELGKNIEGLYVVDCDIGKSMKTVEFSKAFPEKHINVGIAEQSAAGVAAGLAVMGKKPIISTYAVFGSMRMVEQIRQSICYPNLNVKIACSHGGLTPANDGASHQAIEDMGIMRTLPNMSVVMGADYNSTRKLLSKAMEYDGPLYIRFTRDSVPVIYDKNEEFEIGKAKVLRNGTDVTIIAIGDVMSLAITAAEELKTDGINARVLDMHTIKPLDTSAVSEAMDETSGIVTVEDHNVIGGLGSAVSEWVSERGGCPVSKIGLQDRFGESGPYEELLQIHGITVENIKNKVRMILENRKG